MKKDGDRFIISNDALDVVTQGESKEDALDNFREAVQLFIESCYRRGTLYTVLNESGLLQHSDMEGAIEISVPLAVREEQGPGGAWDSFFLKEEGVTDDFMSERASQEQREREPFDS